ncbi:MAG: sulfite exporter TauE/SafE family protein [Clostridia bacterium]|nr:sulfite exporter TauE/SafE family protein [Clostridia bacterium]MDE7329024.1 sulfite exporter TauE/SafE family protein [Clostridia bacterium]
MDRTKIEDNANGGLIEKLSSKKRLILTIVASLFVGVANGLFGGGGGMLVIPIFSILCGLEEKIAHSSAILTILPLSLVSGIIYAYNGNFQTPQGYFVGAGVILGGLIGTFLMKKFSNNLLRIIFYTLMIIAGVTMLASKL